MSFDIVIRRNDTLPVIEKKFYAQGQPVDLSGYTVEFKVFSIDGVTEFFSNPADVVAGGDNNVVHYEWTTQDSIDVTSTYAFARFVATFSSEVLTVPNNRPLSLMLTDNSSAEYSYSGDPSARPLDTVRFLLHDTNMDRALFTDSELLFLLTENGNPYVAAAEAAMVGYAMYVDLKNKTVGPLSVDYGSVASRWRDLAGTLRSRSSKSSGALAITTQSSTAHIFRLGMHDIDVLTQQDILAGEE